MNMSDRIGIMNRGRVEQVGPPTEIYERPTSSFIGRFLGEANLLEGEFRDTIDGAGTIALPGNLTFRGTTPKPSTPGSRVSLFVRPERIELRSPGPAVPHADTNSATGHVRRRSFLGNIIRYAVAVDGAEVTVDVQNAGSQRFEVGDPVALSWAVRDSLLLEE
jgi:ABC-type Fe3+/spermidine/putrescine transport system ATPase subunit